MKAGRAWIVGGLVAIVAVAAALQTLSFRDSSRPRSAPSPGTTRVAGDVAVPDVVGREIEAAEAALRDAGLQPEVFFRSEGDDLWSTVSDQVPAADEEVTEGFPVTVYATRAQAPALELPQMEGGRCPASEARHHEHLRVALGDGRVRLGSATESGVIRLQDSGPQVDTLWTSEGYRGPILIRGGSLNGDGFMVFDQTEDWAPRGPKLHGTREEMRFDGRPPGGLGWHSLVTFSGPGCYGFQIDGRDFTEQIVVEVKDAVAP